MLFIAVCFIIDSRRASIVVRISIVQQFFESIRLFDIEQKLSRSFGISLICPLVGSNVCVAICPCE